MSTSASPSGLAATVRSKFAPIVSSRIGVSVGPASCDFIDLIVASKLCTDRGSAEIRTPRARVARGAGDGLGKDGAVANVNPFRIAIPDADLDDLRGRLARTRWPEAECVDDWSQGIPLAYTRGLAEYWANDYDWRAREDALNRFDQFTTDIDGLDIHFIHQRSGRRERLSAADHPRLAGLDRRVPQGHRAAHRAGLRRGVPVAARIRILRPSPPPRAGASRRSRRPGTR